MVRIRKISEERGREIIKSFEEAFNDPEKLLAFDRIDIEPVLEKQSGFRPYSEFTEEEKADAERRIKILEESFRNPEKLAAMERTIVEPVR